MKCNSKKSRLEDDISAITMYNQGGEDERLLQEIKRKTGSSSRGSVSKRTGKPVSASHESIEIKGQQKGVTLSGSIGDANKRIEFAPTKADLTVTVGMIGPPQIGLKRLEALATMQIRAFIYYINQEAGGVYLADQGDSEVLIMLVNAASRSDWGNSYQTSFRDQFRAWSRWRLIAHAATGYFKCALREKESSPMMAWALEWNKSYRLIGYVGQRGPIESEIADLQAPTSNRTSATERIREEVALDDSLDTLFDFDDGDSDQ